MSYVFPPSFDRSRARIFGGLIEAAYAQMAAFEAGREAEYPVGWDIVLPRFSAHELGGGNGVGKVIQEAEAILEAPGGVFGKIGNALKQHQQNQLPFGFIARQGSEVVVVIRGTDTPMEWVADARTLPASYGDGWGRTTKGFLGLYDQLHPQILGALKPLVDGGEVTEIYVTGHSLGGALATLISAGIYRELQGSGVKPVTYTFSSPRVVDPDFVRAHDSAGLTTWRVFNTEDLVPTLPPAAVDIGGGQANFLNTVFGRGFQHVGYPIGVTAWHADLVSNHSVTNICKLL